ncbi:MAG: MFS transporter [Hyphomicrobium sp.]|nr:MAG: MFS transporter [Hyphomicrobium sp.]PPC99435.1 MAG: MFS transporter [Hyphomicrobium sp.]
METTSSAWQASASSKVRWRLLPFLILCYFAAYLDRVNIGFAALTMNADLGIDAKAFGFIAGIFFLGYCLFEVPSNVLLARFGARVWIARIMVTWALVSAATAFATDVWSLSILRFMLGVAEAGFFPGIIFYLTRWVPASERAAVVAIFMAAVPISNLIGAPVSGLILDGFDGVMELKGWQWLFLIEAAPSLILGIAAYRILDDSPATAAWLQPEERAALSRTIAKETEARERERRTTLREALSDPRVIALGFVYFGIVAGMYGLTFWLPQIVKGFGLSNKTTGFVTAIPYLFAVLAMVAWGARSDRQNERIVHIVLPCACGAVTLAVGAFISTPALAFIFLTLSAMCIFSALPTFWTLPTALLTGAAAAGGIALVNSIGNVGGFIGPYLIGWIKGHGLSSELAVASLAVFLVISAVLVRLVGSAPRQ